MFAPLAHLANYDGLANYLTDIFAAVAFTLGFITVMLIVNDVEWAFFFVGPVGVSCVAAIVYLCLHFFVKDDPEANIERALQRCTTREPTR